MQAELDKVSSLLQQAATSFESHVEDDGCTRLREAAAILEQVIQTSTLQPETPSRAKSVAA